MKTLALILLLVGASFAQNITAPTMVAHTNDKVWVAISGDGTDIISFQFNLYYDDSVLEAVGNDNNFWGCYGGDFTVSGFVVCNGGDPGVYRVAGVNPYGFTGSGTLVNIPFKTIKGDSDFDLEQAFMFDNGGRIEITVKDGGIELQ